MTKSGLFVCLVLTAALAGGAVPLRASDLVGVYGLVERVVFEPTDANPTAVQVWGAFSFAIPRKSDATQSRPAGSFENPAIGSGLYGPVQKGYLYFTCEKGKERTCQAEWTDLKSVAGEDEIVGFGARYGPSNGRVRRSEDRPSSPDVYPLNLGVVRMGRMGTPLGQTRIDYPDLAASLRTAVKGK